MRYTGLLGDVLARDLCFITIVYQNTFSGGFE
jgi:hypothetical protein